MGEVDQRRAAVERHHMIAEAAYYRAERRGFRGGDPFEDWLAAEAEVDAVLRREEIAAFERMRRRARDLLREVRTVNPETLRRIVEQAGGEARELGGYTAEAIRGATAALKKELAETIKRLGPSWEDISARTAGLFSTWLGRGAGFLGEAAGSASEWLRQVQARRRVEPYRTGEMAPPGEYRCLRCSQKITLERAGYLPECPRCANREFAAQVQESPKP